jgi:peptidoglycan/xylan/chitin deacetylase (PgdA/CDA1 family)
MLLSIMKFESLFFTTQQQGAAILIVTLLIGGVVGCRPVREASLGIGIDSWPTATPSDAVDNSETTEDASVVYLESSIEDVPAIPTIAPPPLIPTAPPTATTGAVVGSPGNIESDSALLIATQTAAASPPTPEIAFQPTTEPMPTPSGVYSWTLKVPILMYHYISTPPEDADIYRTDLSVTPEQFREQMAFLQANGYTTVDLYDLSQAIVSQEELPEKPIILTFDDGYLDNYEHAYPILKEFGYGGTFFVVTEFIDTQREGYMTWPMIEEMSRNGMRMESHSRTHPDLRGMSRERLIWEILGSQETLAAHIGYKPRYFCYPGGWYDEATIEMLRELDFWGATTTQNGSWHGFDERFEWRRIRMRNSTTLGEFARLVDLDGTVRGKPVP